MGGGNWGEVGKIDIPIAHDALKKMYEKQVIIDPELARLRGFLMDVWNEVEDQEILKELASNPSILDDDSIRSKIKSFIIKFISAEHDRMWEYLNLPKRDPLVISSEITLLSELSKKARIALENAETLSDFVKVQRNYRFSCISTVLDICNQNRKVLGNIWEVFLLGDVIEYLSDKQSKLSEWLGIISKNRKAWFNEEELSEINQRLSEIKEKINWMNWMTEVDMDDTSLLEIHNILKDLEIKVSKNWLFVGIISRFSNWALWVINFFRTKH